jgi:hypothetical protein
MRDNLLIHGYDSIEYEDNEEAMLIALSASSIRPLAWFSVDQATELGKQIGSLADPEDDKARLVCLQTVLSGLNTDTPYLR